MTPKNLVPAETLLIWTDLHSMDHHLGLGGGEGMPHLIAQ